MKKKEEKINKIKILINSMFKKKLLTNSKYKF